METNLNDWGDIALLTTQIMMGIGLAASAGLRVFVPFLAVGLATRAEMIPVLDSFAWLGDWPALTVFSVATLCEILGDKFPVVDNFLDGAHTFVKPVAGALLMASVVTELSPLQQTVLAITFGSTTAFGIHLAKANLRLVSTAGTGGLANPVVSVAEDSLTFAGAALAIVAPALAMVALGFVITGIWVAGRKLLARRRAATAPPAAPTA